ncbi:hypothetical protein F4009_13960 [Candidatus Poribacteria bacterium]|nr:hypothetical protein [Candidatus Poribacteria bacterium]MYH80613.1 hypothetical protein [Candidatus Poribacteria bacterium]MYK95079.1 hypothetical protein [Candidatus Poribacteria bacterium]
MSDKTQLRWESPLDIYVPHELNNRTLDAGYVESLEDSMITQGYLPTYPIICYRRHELPKEVFDGKTDALYICAAGFHRTTAAKNINLDRVYVELRSGTFEEYLETLNTDNFQFDPEVNTSLGQIWTKTDKRKACKQLLLLPKYFKLTNIALADLWHTSEANVRRWRDDVASSIDEGSLDAPFPISQEWQDTLKAILDSNVREMADGSTVKVRSKPEENKWDYYWALQEKVENHKHLDWNTEIEPYCKQMYEKDARDLSLKKLAELDQLIAIHDPEFMKMCRELGEEKRKLNAAQEECHNAYRAAERAFETYVFGQDLAENTYEEKYKNCLKSFGRAVSRTFGHNLLGSMLYTDKVHKYENKIYQLQQLKKDIEASVDYVQAFAQRMLNAQRKKREKLGQAVIDAHYKMLTAVQEKYPGIDMEKFCFAVDADCSLWLDIGDTLATPMHSTQDIPDGKSDGKLIRIAEHYEKMLEKILEGADWIAKLVPENLPLQNALDEMKAKAETPDTETTRADDEPLDANEDTSLTEIDNLPAVKHFLESLLKQTETFIHPHDKDDFSVSVFDALMVDSELTERQQLLILINCAYSIVMESESTSF